MLQNDEFNEEYFRLEKKIIINNESVQIDRENKIILTTPFIKGSQITEVFDRFGGENQLPKNFNLVIDGITLFSTNPNCQNYLPLKISLGNKIELEFNDARLQEINNYKIVVNPKTNLDTVQNRRYTDSQDLFMGTIGTVVNIVESNNRFFSITATGNIFGTETGGSPDYQVLFNDLPFFLNRIYANNFQAVGFVNDIDKTTVYDLLSSNNTDNNAREIFDITDGQIFSLFLIKNILIVFYLDTSTGNYLLAYFVRNVSTGDYNVVYGVGLEQENQALGIYRETVFYSVRSDGVYEYVLDGNNVVIKKIFDLDNFDIDTIEVVYIGGSNVEKPNISIFTFNTNTLTWLFYSFPYNLPLSREFRLDAPNDENTIRVKRYRNTAYFSNLSIHYFLNLDDFSLVEFNNAVSNNLIPRRPGSIINLTDFNFIESQRTVSNVQQIALVSIFPNKRNLNRVYKLTYNYEERFYLFDLNTYKNFFFSIKLPNDNPISDLEIFSYIIDGRIRYSKEVIDPYGIIPKRDNLDNSNEMSISNRQKCVKGCKKDGDPQLINTCTSGKCVKGYDKDKCRKRCSVLVNRSVGSASRVLGLVDEDFSVSEFLNIYTTV